MSDDPYVNYLWKETKVCVWQASEGLLDSTTGLQLAESISIGPIAIFTESRLTSLPDPWRDCVCCIEETTWDKNTGSDLSRYVQNVCKCTHSHCATPGSDLKMSPKGVDRGVCRLFQWVFGLYAISRKLAVSRKVAPVQIDRGLYHNGSNVGSWCRVPRS